MVTLEPECQGKSETPINLTKQDAKPTRRIVYEFWTPDSRAISEVEAVHSIQTPGLTWKEYDSTMIWYDTTQYAFWAEVTDEVDVGWVESEIYRKLICACPV
jgi:hypothetical protein